MVVATLGLRLKLHLLGIQHLYVFGHIVRHLFSGALIVIFAAFALAFQPNKRWLRLALTAVLGVGSGLVLDEMLFLIATSATKEEYVSSLSVQGSIIFISLGVSVLVILYCLKRLTGTK